jgi:DNA-binding NtrC family response regulator
VPPIVGDSASVRELCTLIDALGRHDCTVLIHGESGTGKELAARQIHARGARRGGPFVPVDCTTLRDTLLESQLFGHVRGAFTGADRSTIGFFRAADGGTLFLDEIGELELPIQAKLLRSIQDHAVVPLGQYTPVKVNVRVIVATHRNLREMVARGQFREDLYYRLNVACLEVPPLRVRRGDVPALVKHALDDLCRVYGRQTMPITRDAMDAMYAYDWPGNVRELMNAIEHALVFARGETITLEDLPPQVRGGGESAHLRADGIVPLAQAERDLIRRTLCVTGGNQSRAATLLQVERHRLRRRILHYGLQDLLRPVAR